MFDFSRFVSPRHEISTFSESKIASSSEDLQKQHIFLQKTQKLCFLCFLLKMMLSWPRKFRILNFQKMRFTLTRAIETQIKLKKHIFRDGYTPRITKIPFFQKKCCLAISRLKKIKKQTFFTIFSRKRRNSLVDRSTTNFNRKK